MADYPHRAVEVTLKITADSDADIASALHQIRTEMALRDGQIGPCVSCGYSSSWSIEVQRRPEQTHDKWFADLQAYLSEQFPASRDGGAASGPATGDEKGNNEGGPRE